MARTVFDDLPIPPIARSLRWKLVAFDPQAGTIDVDFLASADFVNPSGFVQGGMIAARRCRRQYCRRAGAQL